MMKNYDNKPSSSAAAAASDERISVVKLSKSGGCVDRDAAFMKAVRESQIRTYFFGNPVPSTASSALSISSSSTTNVTLSPHAQQLDFNSLSLYNYTTSSAEDEQNDDDDYDEEDEESNNRKPKATKSKATKSTKSVQPTSTKSMQPTSTTSNHQDPATATPLFSTFEEPPPRKKLRVYKKKKKSFLESKEA